MVSNVVAVETVYPANLDDTSVIEGNPTNDYGLYNILFVRGVNLNRKESYLKFNLSQIPVGSTVDSANLSLYLNYHGLDSSDILNITVNRVYAYPLFSINGKDWDEGNNTSGGSCTDNELCWSTKPSSSQMDLAEDGIVFTSSSQVNNWFMWFVRDMVQDAVSNGDLNVTFRLSSVALQSATDLNDLVSFRSKEYFDSSLRPVLAITYSEIDITPPSRFNPQPSSNLPSGTTQATIGLNTNEDANCRYYATAGVDYDLMSNTFSNTGSTYHSTLVTGLSDGNSYAYYVRCIDLNNNANNDDFVIQFSILADTVDTTAPVVVIQEPENIAYNYNDLPLNYIVADDVAVDSCWYNLDNSNNISLLNCQNATFSASEGAHIIYVFANDTSNNINFVTTPFRIELPKIVNQRIKGATYKPNYGNETVEFVVVVMDNKTSIENNVRFVGTDGWNVSYRVINPDNSIYQDWQNITINNSWGIATFNLLADQKGTFVIELKFANETNTLENITFSVSENNKIPFYRDEIIRAADFVVSVQSPDGSFPGERYNYPGSPARPLMWAYRITGNSTYYDAAVNYLEDQINCGGSYGTLYSTCAYAEFQLFSNDAQFKNNLDQCSQSTYNLRNISPY